MKHSGLPVALNRADFNGFWSYIGTHSGYKAGVYSDPAIWTQIFGTGSAASIPHTGVDLRAGDREFGCGPV